MKNLVATYDKALSSLIKDGYHDDAKDILSKILSIIEPDSDTLSAETWNLLLRTEESLPLLVEAAKRGLDMPLDRVRILTCFPNFIPLLRQEAAYVHRTLDRYHPDRTRILHSALNYDHTASAVELLESGWSISPSSTLTKITLEKIVLAATTDNSNAADTAIWLIENELADPALAPDADTQDLTALFRSNDPVIVNWVADYLHAAFGNPQDSTNPLVPAYLTGNTLLIRLLKKKGISLPTLTATTVHSEDFKNHAKRTLPSLADNEGGLDILTEFTLPVFAAMLRYQLDDSGKRAKSELELARFNWNMGGLTKNIFAACTANGIGISSPDLLHCIHLLTCLSSDPLLRVGTALEVIQWTAPDPSDLPLIFRETPLNPELKVNAESPQQILNCVIQAELADIPNPDKLVVAYGRFIEGNFTCETSLQLAVADALKRAIKDEKKMWLLRLLPALNLTFLRMPAWKFKTDSITEECFDILLESDKPVTNCDNAFKMMTYLSCCHPHTHPEIIPALCRRMRTTFSAVRLEKLLQTWDLQPYELMNHPECPPQAQAVLMTMHA